MSIIVQNTPNNTSLPVSGRGGILPENQGSSQKVQKAAQESLADENSYRSGWLNVSGCSRRWNRYVFSKNGDVYTFKFHNGDVYRGQFEKGRFNGQGRLTRPNGTVYEGAFLNGQYHGKGILTDSEGNVYRGQFAQGRFNGQGLYIRKNGWVYAGAFLNGKRHGEGTLKDSEGNVYKGQFTNGQQNGQCRFTCNNGDIYEGACLDGLRHGEGTLKFDGAVYEGQFANGQFNGQGQLTYNDGVVYTGAFLNGKRLGEGILLLANGSVYVGPFLNDMRNGDGTFQYVDGVVYKGGFLNDWWHGLGQITYPDRTCIRGRFEHGQLVDANCSNLSDIKFLKLLIGAPTGGGSLTSYSLGIISDYLIKNFYIEFGIALKSALKFLLNEQLDRIQDIRAILTSCNGPQLFAINADHTAGLNMELLSNSQEVLLEIFNSGEELDSFHPRQELESGGKKKTKYQTMLQFIVPLEGLASLKTDELLKPTNMKELYEKISAIPGARVVKQDFPIWQSDQKADNCTLEWIFAYLKNKMTNEQYIRFRMRFFDHCADLIRKNGMEDRDMVAVLDILVEKIEKRKRISFDELDIDVVDVYKYRS